MKKIFFSILFLLLSSCSNNTTITTTINGSDVEYLISIENVSDSNNGLTGASYSRSWLFQCASRDKSPGYFYIANNYGNYGDEQFSKNNAMITFSADPNPQPLELATMIYVESIYQIDFPSLIKSCISGTFVPKSGIYVKILFQNSTRTITTFKEIGTRVFPSIKNVILPSGKFSF